MILNIFNKKTQKKRKSRKKPIPKKKTIKVNKVVSSRSNKKNKVNHTPKGVKKLIVKKVMSDEEIESKEGTYYDESHYKKHYGVIDYDCDCYYNGDGNGCGGDCC